MKKGRVQGKVALVTGAGSGLGQADALLLAQEGAQVVFADIDGAAAERASQGTAHSLALQQDVRDDVRWAEIMDQIEQDFGRLDILVNNAGIVRYGSLLDCPIEDWRLQMDVMATGTFLGCRHAIPLMARSGGGSIVNIASVVAVKGVGILPGYSAAKGAIVSLTRSTAVLCQEQRNGVRVNAVLPGAHDTPMMRHGLAVLPEDEAGLGHAQAMGQGAPEDVANLVLFLSSDEARHITGATMVIDNGETAR